MIPGQPRTWADLSKEVKRSALIGFLSIVFIVVSILSLLFFLVPLLRRI